MSRKNNKKYSISVSENQLKIIENALECFFRVHFGQHFDLVNDLAFYGFDYGAEHTDAWEKEFNARIERRNYAQDIYDAAYRTACPFCVDKTPEIRSAIDIWHVIRHHFWKELPDENRSDYTTDSYPPFPTAEEPLPRIERIE